MRIVIEKVLECASKTDVAAHGTALAVMNARLDATNAGLVALRTDVATLKTDVATLKTDVVTGFSAVNQRFDTLTAEVERKGDRATVTALEQRVSALEHNERPHPTKRAAGR